MEVWSKNMYHLKWKQFIDVVYKKTNGKSYGTTSRQKFPLIGAGLLGLSAAVRDVHLSEGSSLWAL